MKTNLYFFSLESLQQFAAENVIYNERFIRLPHICGKGGNHSVLEVTDFSEVVPCYEVRKMDDGSNRWYIDADYYVLRIIPTGELFRFSEVSRGKFRLHMFERPAISWRDRDFHFGKKEPNLISKATEKKLSDWIDYLHLERTALMDYVNGNMCRNKTFTERVREKFPFAHFETAGDGWTSEIRFEWSHFYITFTACKNGTFVRNMQIKYGSLPSVEDMLA